jgi:hypothetical protein
LTGHFDAQHAQLARSMLGRIEAIETAPGELDAVIAAAFEPWAHQLDLLQTIPGGALCRDRRQQRPGPAAEALSERGRAVVPKATVMQHTVR